MSQSTAPLEDLAGRWNSDMQMSSRLLDKQDENYFWVGPVHGEVFKTGKIAFLAKNKCELTGLLTPRVTASRGYYGTVNAIKCEQPAMNRQYTADVTVSKGNMTVRLTSKRMVGGRLTGHYEMFSTFGRP